MRMPGKLRLCAKMSEWDTRRPFPLWGGGGGGGLLVTRLRSGSFIGTGARFWPDRWILLITP